MTEFKNGDQVLVTVREHLARHDQDLVRLYDLQREHQCSANKCRENLGERLHIMERETKEALHSLEKQIGKVSWTVTTAVAIIVAIVNFVVPMLLKAM
jgi:outer membrane protein assembly factor BamD (BamD/ComL family)